MKRLQLARLGRIGSLKGQIEQAVDNDLTMVYCSEISFKRKRKDSTNPKSLISLGYDSTDTVLSLEIEVKLLTLWDICIQAEFKSKTSRYKEGTR